MSNCNGCKYLDQYGKGGNGYCCHVELSKQGKDERNESRRKKDKSKIYC